MEREWLSFGHKFTTRLGFLATEGKEVKEASPVFGQFLECVWHFKCQHPAAFQYNNHFLVTLHQHSYACEVCVWGRVSCTFVCTIMCTCAYYVNTIDTIESVHTYVYTYMYIQAYVRTYIHYVHTLCTYVCTYY